MREKRSAYRILVGKPERAHQEDQDVGVDNIKIDLREIGWDDMDLIDLAEVREQWRAVVNTVKNLRVSLNAWKFLSNCTIGSFSRRTQLRK
jgi:hypothetical protein